MVFFVNGQPCCREEVIIQHGFDVPYLQGSLFFASRLLISVATPVTDLHSHYCTWAVDADMKDTGEQ